MPPSSRLGQSAAWLAAAAALALLTAAAAQDAPKSILPEDVFGPAPQTAPVAPIEPNPSPAPASPEPSASPSDGEVSAGPDAAPSPGVPGPAATAANPLDSAAPTADMTLTGLLTPAAGGYGPAAFAGSDGRVLGALMRSMRAPIASRWAHIALVRALASIVPTPDGVRPADWVAERASLLMRLGESDVAHALVERVPVDRYTPRLYGVAFDAALAAADPGAICPLAQTGRTLFRMPVWRLGAAMCASFDGDDIAAAQGFQSLRTEGNIDPFDIALAERVAASAGEGARRGSNAEWGEVEQVNLYRLGLGIAAGAPPPERLMATLPAPAQGWLFRAAAAPDAARAGAAGAAAAQGIVGSGELVAFYAALAAESDAAGVGGDTPGRLRQAWAGAPADRMASMRALWEAGRGPDRYAALVLSAGAAASLRPDKRFAAYAADLMASALAGGRADAALRWWPMADAEGGDVARRAWAYAAVAGDAVPVDRDRFDAWRKADGGTGTHRAAVVLAALGGLGRATGSEWDGVRRELGMGVLADRWTARIDAAAAAGRVGEVLVLAGTGLQCDWAAVPPQHLAHILAALVRVGRGTEARSIAAEAVTRA